MELRNMRIGEIDIPTVLDNRIVYYPVSMISTKVMLRSGKGGLINTKNKDKYSEYLHTYKIKFSEDNIQDCRCISQEGLKVLLLKTQHSRLSKEQKMGQNLLHDKLGLKLLPIDYERDTDKYDMEELKSYDTYTSEIIKYQIDNFSGLTFRQCAKCLNNYPLANTFYSPDKRRPKGFVAVCVVCEGKREFFKHNDSIKEDARSSNYELYEAINHAYVERVYAAYLEKKIKKIPESFINKECFFRIVDYIDEHGNIDKHNFTYTDFINENRLRKFTKLINNIDMYTYFFGEDFYLFPWRYPKFNLSSIDLTFEIYNKIFRNYLETM